MGSNYNPRNRKRRYESIEERAARTWLKLLKRSGKCISS